jgi:hypothetical protein
VTTGRVPPLLSKCAYCHTILLAKDDWCAHPLDDGENEYYFCSQRCCGLGRDDLEHVLETRVEAKEPK